jgi:hypothetical protein
MARQSQKGWAGPQGIYPSVDLSSHESIEAFKRRGTQNLLTIHDLVPQRAREKGLHWYDIAHEAGLKGVKGTSLAGSASHAAGIISAISPGMEYEGAHIPAFHAIMGLQQHEWDIIGRSAQHKVPDPSPTNPDRMKSARSPEAHALLSQKHLRPIARASDQQLVNAGKIRAGADPSEVLARGSAPKTYSFWHNIAHPDLPHHMLGAHIPGPVTIDGRAHDEAVNRMMPWEYSGRGISGPGRPVQQRYSLMEDIHRQAAAAASGDYAHTLHPHQFQAINWEGGKLLERGHIGHVIDPKFGYPVTHFTLGGTERKGGVERVGQPYVGPWTQPGHRGLTLGHPSGYQEPPVEGQKARRRAR